ncbi:hypothetical protein AMATHDRAFT_50508 [Amanita thiersii Skay4041]|uniref:Ankyrin repeat protein n=1 Tax=Amanita thiersii Skay4041 TaxID=703135 RepID=A0A2A9NAQ3_9AGAR|nr:hypothetical protein AMATHDRAFT_50508 [Amanita thiersii Skay4041]
MIAAGGSVLACLTPLVEEEKVSKKAMRRFYHVTAYPTSDVDLFLWGLTSKEAEKKIVTIYEAVLDSIPWDVTCIRTKHAITLYSQYPYRSIQIVLRLYKSPAEIISGFDIDASCCAYDGDQVWANPRAIVAMMRQCNAVDVTLKSISYEVGLSKYAKRCYEIHVPTLIRSDIDPTIFTRPIIKIEGLARLLVFEKFATVDEQYAYFRSGRGLGVHSLGFHRPEKMNRRYPNDLKALNDLEELESNDHGVVLLHIPYGPGWDAQSIDKLIYQTNLEMNCERQHNLGRPYADDPPSKFRLEQQRLQATWSSCFLWNNTGMHGGLLQGELLPAERELQVKEDQLYTRGRISFVEERPVHPSMTSGFNLIVGDWSAHAYIDLTGRFFSAIAAHDRATVSQMIKEGIDVNRRDHVGRSPLQLAIICRATEIACDLVDASARMTTRFLNGRTSLHFAVELNQGTVVPKLLERSALNKERSSAQDESGRVDGDGTMKDLPSEHSFSEDDWSFEGEKVKISEPDVFDINSHKWNSGFNPLGHAVLFASVDVVEDLIAAGADVTLSTHNRINNAYPLALTILKPDEDEACKIVQRLILAGASSFPATDSPRSFFASLLQRKSNWCQLSFVRVVPIEEDVIKALAIRLAIDNLPMHGYADFALHRSSRETINNLGYWNTDPLNQAFMPIEVAFVNNDDVVDLLASLGADVNRGTMLTMHSNIREEDRRSLLDWIDFGIQWTTNGIMYEVKVEHRTVRPIDFSGVTSWKEFALLTLELATRHTSYSGWREREKELASIREYLEAMRQILIEAGAKTRAGVLRSPTHMSPEQWDFVALISGYSTNPIPRHMVPQYNELFEACFSADDEKIQALCLSPDGSSLPLQITVQFRNPENPFSPARLILAIAVAQHKPQEDKANFSVDIDEDGFDDSSESSDEVEVTCATQSAKSRTEPMCMTLIDKAIKRNDLEMFVKLVNMGTDFSVPVVLEYRIFDDLMNHDRHEMLDVLIRNTGLGMDLDVVKSEGKVNIPINDKNKLYLGLNVYGRKRTNLTGRNGPGVFFEPPKFPLLWMALMRGAVNIVNYLAGERPYAAYRSYAMSYNDELAERLRGIDNLKELLPLWFGWRIDPLGESPLTAAVLHGKLDTIKVLFVERKQLMTDALHVRYNIGKLNLLQVAVRASRTVEVDLLDFFWNKGCHRWKRMTRDQSHGANSRNNIYHILCKGNKVDLLRHLLKKLPLDTNETLVKQQTEERQQTPLHIAVENGSINAVRSLLAYSRIANTIRDSNAASEIFSRIRIGDKLRWFQYLKNIPQPQNVTFTGIATDPPRFQLSHLEKEVPALRQTIELLLNEGRLLKDSKLEKELLRFADKIEGHMRRLQQESVKVTVFEVQDEHPIDSADMEATLKVVDEAAKKGDGKRKLVPLINVQQSVEYSIKEFLAESRLQESLKTADDVLRANEVKVEKCSFVQEHATL